MSSHTALTDLESRLAAPDGAVQRDAMVARTQGLARRLRAELDAGLPRADFAAYSAVAAAADAATAVLVDYPLPQDRGADARAPAQPFSSFSPR
ncbi:hypothetical protein ACILG0_18625 [Pseudomonadota bacterium AL_CKDN230030165-1A_HGKHYDSX7]